jgi:hypothetical protein
VIIYSEEFHDLVIISIFFTNIIRWGLGSLSPVIIWEGKATLSYIIRDISL